MELNETLQKFCEMHGYIGCFEYNHESKKCYITISKDNDNAGAFLEEEEYQELDENKLMEILVFLDRGFKAEFNK